MTTQRNDNVQPIFEPLEPRVLLAADFQGFVPVDPSIQFNNTGTINYDAASDQLTVDAEPLSFQPVGAPFPNFIFFDATFGRDFQIDIIVDDNGDLVSGVAGDDLVIEGNADLNGDFVGDGFQTLLTGEIVHYAAQDGATPGVDAHEFIFEVTGGAYATEFPNGFIGVTMTSEGSTFVGDYTVDFTGGAKGDAGVIDAPVAQLAGLGDFVWRDSDTDGIQDTDEAGIEGVLIELLDDNGTVVDTTTTDAFGMYEFTELDPGTYSTRVADSNFDAGNALQGLTPTLQDVGDDELDSDGNRTSPIESAQTTLAGGDFDPTLDFGFFSTGITLEKTGPDSALAGETIEFVFTVTNTGDADLTDVVINDPLISDTPILVGDLASGQTTAVSQSFIVPGAPMTVIDFEVDGVGDGLDAGTVIDDEYAALGLTVTTDNPTHHPAMIFDSANPTGGDTDLGTPHNDFGGPGVGSGGEAGAAGENSVALNNILILSEDGDSSDPDDDASGGTLIFTFEQPKTIESVSVLDIDGNEPGSNIELFDASGNLIDTFALDNLSNNSFQQVAVNTADVAQMRVNFVSSGAVTEIVLDGELQPITNIATVVGTPVPTDTPDVTDEDDHRVDVVDADPGIDIEKLTNGVDADDPTQAIEIAPGDTVTWTYEVTNTGNVAFDRDEVVVVDDNGTPGHTGDDFAPALDESSDAGDDDVLSPGETWVYTASAPAQDLGSGTGETLYFNTTGSSGLDGENGNIRTYTDGGVTVNASAFSKASNGEFRTAFLGAFSSGLGVTDRTEGDGGNGLHRTDNVGEQNFILFEFSETVEVDSLFLDSVVNDSDISVWIGTVDGAFASHQTLDQALLDSLEHYEVNNTGSSNDRWANINGDGVTGNVLVVAASIEDHSPEDRFKLRQVKAKSVEAGVFGNIAVVTAPGASDDDASHYDNPAGPTPTPGIDIEKFTNGVNADWAKEAVEIAAGDTVTWTYEVTNTGNVAFTEDQVSVTDDNGTAGHTADDFAPTLIVSTDAGQDGILSPGETWTYEHTAVADALGGSTGDTVRLDLSGHSATDGHNGNTRTFSNDGVNVRASAFSSNRDGSDFKTAYLGAYGNGLGVTDRTEGNGGKGLHRTDNVGKFNYVLFEFSETVVLDKVFLDSVGKDSDISVWIGTIEDAFNRHTQLDASVLLGLEHYESNWTSSNDERWADVNAGEVSGNVVVIAASIEDHTPEDRFKIDALKVQRVTTGIYGNVAKVTAGGATDSDASHYTNASILHYDADDRADDKDHWILKC